MADEREWNDFINAAIEERRSDINSINRLVHENPELAYQEFQAHDNLVSLLTKLGFQVTPSICGVRTAFAAEYGSGGRLVVFNSEYDALPGIGHACGHNLIASAGLASFLGVADALRKSGRQGRVRLVGTPAEEGGGGKLPLIEGGLYRDAAACLMTHPGPQYLLAGRCQGVAAVKMLANIKWRIFFSGEAAHAAMEPWNGRNALDALCIGYVAVSALRQQIRPAERLHGVFTRAGDRPNVIPHVTSLDYYVRSDSLASAERLWQRVKNCWDAAALATGCTVRYEPINSYADVRSSSVICREFCHTMGAYGHEVSYDDPIDFLAGSTDMGNVTYECPGFHGSFGIDTEVGQGNHTEGFARAAGLEKSFGRNMDWSKGMARVAWKVLTDDEFATRVKEDWEEDMKRARA
ncbi:hypothetical protein NLU13_1049 [Sarocladium strictum]|uniref:Peptidase M20 domain-containing protein 2 n=1 Tax=Sarocladium strictum TaxID=5046 RepID=A0AA39LC35_SARSR|nr:hypothetical protein NLU13_1049 [Sarocladium strictum]